MVGKLSKRRNNSKRRNYKCRNNSKRRNYKRRNNSKRINNSKHRNNSKRVNRKKYTGGNNIKVGDLVEYGGTHYEVLKVDNGNNKITIWINRDDGDYGEYALEDAEKCDVHFNEVTNTGINMKTKEI